MLARKGNGLTDTIVESGDVTSYTPGKPLEGLMYTCNGGFIDFGHLFDNLELTLYYNFFLTKGGLNKAGDRITIFNSEGTVTLKKPVPTVDAPMIAASIAFDYSVFYEILTYWINFPGSHNSSFSPEDLVSNYTGVRIAEKALSTPGKTLNTALQDELKRVLGLLDARSRAQTFAALTAISGVWVLNADDETALGLNGYLLRRNYSVPIAPCFVTAAGTGCTGTPAYPAALPNTFPSHIAGYYDVEFDVPILNVKARNMLGSTVKKSSFTKAVTDIKADKPASGTPC